jgi:hypothetical protein
MSMDMDNEPDVIGRLPLHAYISRSLFFPPELSEDEYVPPPPKAKTKGKAKGAPLPHDDDTPITAPRRLSKISLADMDDLEPAPDGEDSVLVIPNRKARANAIANGGPDVTYVPQQKGEVDTAKKKKR